MIPGDRVGPQLGGGGCQFFSLEYMEKIFNNLFLKNHEARKAGTCVEASLGSEDSSLLK